MGDLRRPYLRRVIGDWHVMGLASTGNKSYAAGGHALLTEGAMQRQLRDIYGVSAYHGFNWDAAAGNYGAHLFGLDPARP